MNIKKIYVNQMEKISACTILPIGIFVAFVPLYFISLLFNSNNIQLLIQWDSVFFLIIIYIPFGLLIFGFLLYFIFFAICKNKLEYLQIEDEQVVLKIKSTDGNRIMNVYEISRSDILSVEYCICKWYAMPILYFYKQQSGGELKIITKDKIYFMRILYSDYKKIARYFQIETI